MADKEKKSDFGPPPDAPVKEEPVKEEPVAETKEEPKSSTSDLSARYEALAKGKSDLDEFEAEVDKYRTKFIAENNLRPCFGRFDASDYDCRSACPDRVECHKVVMSMKRPPEGFVHPGGNIINTNTRG